ncbi:MAG: DHA2 family efflux MFS transporter permease subunit [Planctomycetia bacterium]|jgi:DHA2 family multidrug resistance protein|nr:DHA2 family efflux MFS transporter permease subunit [Planctomycetia bacterium]
MSVIQAGELLTPRRAFNPWMVAPVVAMAAFMEVLDTTIVNVALPHIAGNMSTSIDQSTWVLTSYLVANAIVLPLNGFMSAVFGRKRYFLACMTLFTLSSLMCGMAPTFGTLLMFRVLQGLGGGGLQPGAQAILRDIFPLQKIGTAMALYGIVVIVAPVLGPVLGGWITDSFSWRWCFLINVPIGIVSVFLLSILLRESADQRRIKLRDTGFDYVGLSLMVVGLAALQIMLDRGENADWFGSLLIRVLAVVAVLGLVSAFVWEWYQEHPIVNLRMLEDRNFGLATVGMFLFGGILYSSTTLLPLMVQTLMGYDARLAGLVLAPGGMVVFFLMPLVGFLVPRVPTRWLICLGVLGNVVALMMMAKLNLQASFMALAICRSVQGLGLAFLFVPFNTAAFGFISKRNLSDASGIINLARNIGGSIGISCAVAFVKNNSQVHQMYLVGNANLLNRSYHSGLAGLQAALVHAGVSVSSALHEAQSIMYNSIRQHAGMMAYVTAYQYLAALFLLVIPVALLLRTPRFHEEPQVMD